MKKETHSVDSTYDKIESYFNNDNNNFSFNSELFSLEYILETYNIDINNRDIVLDPILDSLVWSKKHIVTKIHGILQLIFLSNIYNYGQWISYKTKKLVESINGGCVYFVDKKVYLSFSVENLDQIKDLVNSRKNPSFEMIILWSKESIDRP